MRLLATASQTVGPYFWLGLSHLARNNLVPAGFTGEYWTIQGRMLDGDGVPVSDGMIEIWQADTAGNFPRAEISPSHSAVSEFAGFGRIPTDENGFFQFTTVKPGQTPAPQGGLQAPHLVVLVFSRGLLRNLLTRIYFPGEPANTADPILNLVPVERRSTLIARQLSENSRILEWNIRLQGEDETVFFEA